MEYVFKFLFIVWAIGLLDKKREHLWQRYLNDAVIDTSFEEHDTAKLHARIFLHTLLTGPRGAVDGHLIADMDKRLIAVDHIASGDIIQPEANMRSFTRT